MQRAELELHVAMLPQVMERGASRWRARTASTVRFTLLAPRLSQYSPSAVDEIVSDVAIARASMRSLSGCVMNVALSSYAVGPGRRPQRVAC